MRLCQLVDATVAGDIEKIAADLAAVEPLPIEFVARFFGELLSERPKRAAVAVAEWVNVIKFGVKLGKDGRELGRVEAAQLVGLGIFEHLV